MQQVHGNCSGKQKGQRNLHFYSEVLKCHPVCVVLDNNYFPPPLCCNYDYILCSVGVVLIITVMRQQMSIFRRVWGTLGIFSSFICLGVKSQSHNAHGGV